MSEPGRRVVAYIDGGARGNPGPAGYGVRIEDQSGTVIGELHEGIGVATNNVAEYRGLLAALAYLERNGHQDVLIRSDSQLLTKQMLGQYRVRHAGLKALHAEARSLVDRIGQVRFEHVPRADNAEADRLANLAMDEATGQPTPKKKRRPAPPRIESPVARRAGAVLAAGIDVESVARMDDLLRRYGRRFLDRVFTTGELEFCLERRFPAQHFAGRFCAKEAALKALGTGQTAGVHWKHVEVVREDGPPQLRLHGGAARCAEALGVGRTLVTISHSGDIALAQVLLLSE